MKNQTSSLSPDGSGILAWSRFFYETKQDIAYSGTTSVVRKEVVLLKLFYNICESKAIGFSNVATLILAESSYFLQVLFGLVLIKIVPFWREVCFLSTHGIQTNIVVFVGVMQNGQDFKEKIL
jgi:hypothetical protein